jgi:signal peptidase II
VRWRGNLALQVSVAVILVDQVVKLLIKTNMQLGERITVFHDWFHLLFVENNGMAFGMELGGDWGKILLTLFRLIAIVIIGRFLFQLEHAGSTRGARISVALVFSGALGNLIDCIFYGVAFNYAPLLQGKVVDMLYFPLFEGFFPSWFPIWGGEPFLFFSPVFNLADMAISTGVGLLLVFQKRYFPQHNQ